jgi:hypothetical protein
VSSNLYWRQAEPPPPSNLLPYGLKKAISQRFWSHDGSLHGEEVLITIDDMPYFEGLADAGVDGAASLVEVIQEKDRILIWIGG